MKVEDMEILKIGLENRLKEIASEIIQQAEVIVEGRYGEARDIIGLYGQLYNVMGSISTLELLEGREVGE